MYDASNGVCVTFVHLDHVQLVVIDPYGERGTSGSEISSAICRHLMVSCIPVMMAPLLLSMHSTDTGLGVVMVASHTVPSADYK